ncbi:Uncharacterized protein wiht hemolysin-type calcium-binding regions [Synechococcus sp. RCC307]|nr:Uncharacterized protein wiht hemolysin-type calcium-binding regions [Synechococcus sp. RCC307]
MGITTNQLINAGGVSQYFVDIVKGELQGETVHWQFQDDSDHYGAEYKNYMVQTVARLDNIIDLDFEYTGNYSQSVIDVRLNDSGPFCGQAAAMDGYIELDIWTNGSNSNDRKNTFIHELGHALGLGEPGWNRRWDQDDTAMSYNKGNVGGYATWYRSSDINALISIWGRENDHKNQTQRGKANLANNLYGGKGNDKLFGGNKSDILSGGNGADSLFASLGNDTINGGSGRDTAQFSSRSNRINLNTTSWQNTGDGRDRLISIENVNAGSGNDVVTGNRGANTLKGQNGHDVLNGAAGRDYLIGGRGNDRLKGGSGNDKLLGGQGNDKLWGQGGRDTFVLSEGAGYDRIMDFRNGQDRIQLGSGVDNLRINNHRNGHAYVYEGRDLMAVVNGAAGDLQEKDNFLV